jgi:GNAT superfamily N-acetyltransferase
MPTSLPLPLVESSDVIHTRRGDELRLRFLTPVDAETLQAYVRSLSVRSRHNRFLGALSELPKAVLEDFVALGRNDRFTLVATMESDGGESIVAEARYALDRDTGRVEFGLSVQDRWHGHGIGPALMTQLERRARDLGGVSLAGDTLRANDVMIALAKKSGFDLRPHPDDWTLVRFEKALSGASAQPSSAGLQLVPQPRMTAHS